MNILITGGAGFIGSKLAHNLASAHSITIIDSFDKDVHPQPEYSMQLLRDIGCRVIHCNLIDITPELDIPRPDIVFHLASKTGTGESMYRQSLYIENNIHATTKLLDFLREQNWIPIRFVLTSSRAVYGDGIWSDGDSLFPWTRTHKELSSNTWIPEISSQRLKFVPNCFGQPTNPISLYGMTKLWQEQLINTFCQSFSCSATILRLQNVYGPGQQPKNPYTGIVGIFSSLIMQEQQIDIFEDGLITRDFIYIDDVVKVLSLIIGGVCEFPEFLDLGTGVATTLIDLVNTIGSICAKKPFYHVSGHCRVGDVRCAVADASKLNTIVPVDSFTSLECGLTNYINWLRGKEMLSLESLDYAITEMEETGLLIK